MGDLRAILPFEKTIKENWYKKAIKDKNLEQGYIDLFKRTRSDMDALDALPDRFRDKAVRNIWRITACQKLLQKETSEMLEALGRREERRQEEQKLHR